MTSKNKLNKFLELQSKGVKIEEIAKELDSEVKDLRRFLNQNGYKSVKGKYKLKEVLNGSKQLEISVSNTKSTSKSKAKSTSSSTLIKDANLTKNTTKSKTSKPIKKTIARTKTSKVNMTEEDMDKLCEVYDWYLSIKDLKILQPKKRKNTKDISIDECDMSNLKSTSIKVEKSTWEEFERLCSNSDYTKQEILTQAIKNFLKEHKNLL